MTSAKPLRPNPHAKTRVPQTRRLRGLCLAAIVIVWPTLAADPPAANTDTSEADHHSTTSSENRPHDMGPDTVMLRELQNLYQPVPFDHRGHADMAEMWNGCVTCHHRSPNGHAPHRSFEALVPIPTTQPSAPTSDQPTPRITSLAPPNGRHSQQDADAIPACKSCHPIAADEADIAMPSLKGAYHRQCLSCHREWAHENACVVCHQPLQNDVELVHEPTPDDILGRMHPPIEAPTEKRYEARFTPVAGGNVLFRHDAHIERYGLRCVDCHREDNCARCHDPAAKTEAKAGPLTPADSWRQSHGPCLNCHAQQRCEHCHYAEGREAPAPFDHRITRQRLDDDHDALACAQCHPSLSYDQPPTCDTADCHDPQAAYVFPRDRPGDVDEINEPTPAEQHRLASMRGLPTAEAVIPKREPKAVPARIVRALQPLTPPRTTTQTQPADGLTRIVAPTGPTDTCVTDACHAVMSLQAVVHAPVSNNACGACHRVLDVETHTFAPIREDAALCTYCHNLNLDTMPRVHEPLARGECLGCHNPHGGENHAMTRESTVAQLCNRCHESVTHGRGVAHTPVQEGRCVDCHPPHAARFEGLVDVKGADLCLSCHDDIERNLAALTVKHDAMDEGCLRCHDVHASNTASILVDAPAALCMDCHDTVRDAATRAVYGHSVVLEDRACMTCHAPHGANLDHLMNDTPLRVCMTCHDQPLEVPVSPDTADGPERRTIAALQQVLEPDTFKHGPLRDDECGGCHQPHGSDRAMLLSAEYARGFYEIFSRDKYELCFSCHDAQLVESQWTQSATAFRNGRQNLHFVHVANWKAHSCAACHESHAGPRQRHLRQFIPFGNWQVPLDYQKTTTGGQCGPGCHRAFAYDREAVIELTQATTAPVEQAARRDPPVVLHHTASDITGRPVHIPDPQRPTLLVMTRVSQTPPAVLADLLADLAAALPDTPQTQPHERTQTQPADPVGAPIGVVVIASGPDGPIVNAATPASHATTLDSWPVVRDPDDVLAQQLSVRAWPTLLIVQSDGLVVARISGASPTLAVKLQSYLSDPRASGRGAVAANGRADGTPTIELVELSPDGIVDRYHRIVRRLLDEGRTPQADRVLDEALALHPDANTLRALKVEALVQLGQATDALILLDQLNGHALDAVAQAVLRSRALISADRWSEASQHVTATLRDHPDVAELYELMGRIHEHHQRWQQAAEAYRIARELSRG